MVEYEVVEDISKQAGVLAKPDREALGGGTADVAIRVIEPGQDLLEAEIVAPAAVLEGTADCRDGLVEQSNERSPPCESFLIQDLLLWLAQVVWLPGTLLFQVVSVLCPPGIVC